MSRTAREEAVLIKDGQAHVLALQSRTFIPLDPKVTRDELLKQLPKDLVDELPAIGRVQELQARTQVRRHMLATAIRMVREDRSVLPRSDDSGGAMSLTSRRTATGFELVSPMTMNGEPVTLRVGEWARFE